MILYCSQEHTIDAITPNHLVNPGRSAPSVIINKEHAEYAWELDEEEYRLALLHTLECRDTLLAKFVQHWHQQYLLGLREQYNIKYQDQSPHLSPYLKFDSIVLLQSPLKSKSFWKLFRISELLPGPDGEIRSVRICKPDGTSAVASILHLYPLELEVSQAEGEGDDALPNEPAATLPAVPVLESSPETESPPASPPLSSNSFEEESTHSVPRPRPLWDPSAEEQDSGEMAPTTSVTRPRRQAALKFKDKFDSWRRNDLV